MIGARQIRKMLTGRKTKKTAYALMTAAAVLCCAFLFWKARYGFANSDESFYLTIPFRLLNGDRLVVDEWNVTQFSSLLLLVPAWVSRLFSPDNTGIVLAFRYFYTVIQIATGFFIFFALKRYSMAGAFFSAILFTLYTPFGIMAASYNSLGIICLTDALILYLKGYEKPSFWRCFLAGVLFAFSVLCSPYLAFLFFLYTAAVFVLMLVKKAPGICAFRRWLYLTSGIAVPALIVTALLLHTGTPRSLIALLSDIVRDPEHPVRGFSAIVIEYFRALLFSSSISKYVFLGYFICLAGLVFKRKLARYSRFLLVCSFLLTGAYLVSLFLTNRFLNFLLLPLNMQAAVLFLYTNRQDIRKLFYHLWIPGMLFTFLLHCSSNQELYAIASASAVALPGSVMMLVITASSELKAHKTFGTAAAVLVSVLLLLQAAFMGIVRYESVFWEKSMKAQTVLLESGSEKGLIVSEARSARYQISIQDAAEISADPSVSDILCLSESIWMYLEMPDLDICSYSAWLYGLNEHTLPNLKKYYDMFEHKLPDAVYVELENSEFADAFCEMFDFSPAYLKSGNILLKRNS